MSKMTFAVLLSVGLSSLSLAKGLDSLQPAMPAPQPAPVLDSSTTAAPAESDAVVPANPTETPAEKSEAAVAATVQPSAASKAISDRLTLTTGLGLINASASTGKWFSRGGAELGAYYELALARTPSFAVSAGMRYVAFDVTVEDALQSYRGVVEGYYLGTIARFSRQNRLSFVGVGELGWMSVHLNSLNRLPPDDKLNAAGVNVSLGGGMDWQLQPKLYAGPRLMLGFGRLQTIQVSGNATLVF